MADFALPLLLLLRTSDGQGETLVLESQNGLPSLMTVINSSASPPSWTSLYSCSSCLYLMPRIGVVKTHAEIVNYPLFNSSCGEYGGTGVFVRQAISSYLDAEDPRLGCKLNRPPLDHQLRNNDNELVEFPWMITVGYDYFPEVSSKNSCLQNSSCILYRIDECSQVLTMWNSSTLSSMFDSLYSTPFLKMSMAEISRIPEVPSNKREESGRSSSKRKILRKPWPAAYVVAAILLVAAAVMVLAVWKFYKAKRLRAGQSETMGNSCIIQPEFENSPRYFKLKELCEIASNIERKLDEDLALFSRELSKVVVKRLEAARQGLKQFMAEEPLEASVTRTWLSCKAMELTASTTTEFVEYLALY
ncbi:hypothetical protein SELMODRAFT_423906 [Selaginella moellendorffii]|uniref:Uncharacterized protein n=1 Tax=Selaginella moellendorffii TaxID=88036 RepID=D8SN69_SELML|nr:hypothetical protein SELMODRAFT_423906 [Selaginella moellendorffii]